MIWVNMLGIPLLAVIGISLLPTRLTQVNSKWWFRGLMLWVIFGSVANWVSLRELDLKVLTGTNLLSWAAFLTTTSLVSVCLVMLLWPDNSKTIPKWRLELGMGLIVLSSRLAWVCW